MKIGFIGTGVMGAAIVGHLLKADYEVNVFNRTKCKTDPLVEQGAIWQETPQAVAQASDLIFTMVGGPEDVSDIYRREDGVFAGAVSEVIVVDLTTSTPTLAQELFEDGRSRGIQVLDAPVSGGDIGARNASLSIMVGGDQEAYTQILPVLEVFGKTIEHVGLAGSGQHMKVANQIMVASTLLGTGETLAYAKSAGLDLEQMLRIVGNGAAANFSLNTYGPRILEGDFSPGFYVHHMIKDLGIALTEAEKFQLKLPTAALAKEMYQRLLDEGCGDEGVQAIAKLWFDSYR